jgi:hypothetical protein
MQDRSWNLTRRSFEPPIQPVQQKKETQEIGKQIDRYTIINKIETPAQANLLSVEAIKNPPKWVFYLSSFIQVAKSCSVSATILIS